MVFGIIFSAIVFGAIIAILIVNSEVCPYRKDNDNKCIGCKCVGLWEHCPHVHK